MACSGGALGGLDDGLADAMVLVLAELGFLADTRTNFFLAPWFLSLESLSLDVVLAADSFDRLAAMPLGVVARGGDLAIPMSTPMKSVTGSEFLGNVDGDDQDHFPSSEAPGRIAPCVGAVVRPGSFPEEGNKHATFEGQQADPVDTLKLMVRMSWDIAECVRLGPLLLSRL